jgi:hypothetical protein
MFILDSLFMSGFRWVLNTVVTAAEAEMNDDTALRDQLLAAEMRREMGEISDAEFAEIEADLLARMREIKTRREGAPGPIALEGPVGASGDSRIAVEATVSGDFHELPPDAAEPGTSGTSGTRSGTTIEGTLMEPRDQRTPRRRMSATATPRAGTAGRPRARRASRTSRKIRR